MQSNNPNKTSGTRASRVVLSVRASFLHESDFLMSTPGCGAGELGRRSRAAVAAQLARPMQAMQPPLNAVGWPFALGSAPLPINPTRLFTHLKLVASPAALNLAVSLEVLRENLGEEACGGRGRGGSGLGESGTEALQQGRALFVAVSLPPRDMRQPIATAIGMPPAVSSSAIHPSIALPLVILPRSGAAVDVLLLHHCWSLPDTLPHPKTQAVGSEKHAVSSERQAAGAEKHMARIARAHAEEALLSTSNYDPGKRSGRRKRRRRSEAAGTGGAEEGGDAKMGPHAGMEGEVVGLPLEGVSLRVGLSLRGSIGLWLLEHPLSLLLDAGSWVAVSWYLPAPN